MGWASGSELAEQLWEEIRDYIPKKDRIAAATRFIEAFEQADCDTMEECEQLQRDADRLHVHLLTFKLVGAARRIPRSKLKDAGLDYKIVYMNGDTYMNVVEEAFGRDLLIENIIWAVTQYGIADSAELVTLGK